MSYRKILANEAADVSKWGIDLKIYDADNPAMNYFGRLKMVLMSVPAFRADDEEHIRLVEKSESLYA